MKKIISSLFVIASFTSAANLAFDTSFNRAKLRSFAEKGTALTHQVECDFELKIQRLEHSMPKTKSYDAYLTIGICPMSVDHFKASIQLNLLGAGAIALPDKQELLTQKLPRYALLSNSEQSQFTENTVYFASSTNGTLKVIFSNIRETEKSKVIEPSASQIARNMQLATLHTNLSEAEFYSLRKLLQSDEGV
ncbi:hypothetical protein ACFFK7_10310 [Pseudoalteromonas xiamenensis]|uniref:hypothetical protein n=1 Tax=Pseudoalteromonas xiamenensis TaxID=882626 RepID=UPI0035E6253D